VHVVRFGKFADVGSSRKPATLHGQVETLPKQLQGAVDRGWPVAGNQFALRAALAGEPPLDVLVNSRYEMEDN